MKDMLSTVFPWIVLAVVPLLAVTYIVWPPSDNPRSRVVMRCSGGGLLVLYVGFFLGLWVASYLYQHGKVGQPVAQAQVLLPPCDGAASAASVK